MVPEIRKQLTGYHEQRPQHLVTASGQHKKGVRTSSRPISRVREVNLNGSPVRVTVEDGLGRRGLSMQPMPKTAEPSESRPYRLQAVDRVDEATTPINPLATAILIVVATAWMIALFALAMRVAAQLNLGG